MRILLVGNGGREHALAWSLSKSKLVTQIFVVPGNGGTAQESKAQNIPNIEQKDFPALLSFAIEHKIDLLVPGPEAPLVEGIVDYFHEHGPTSIACFGPTKDAARMEGSKAFAKDFMHRHGIPTAGYKTFTSFDKAKEHLDSHRDMKVVIKADGLAAGKGVIIPRNYAEAVEALQTVMVNREFGAAGASVVIEEFLEGEELSVLSFSDGQNTLSLPAAQDHKRVNDNDEGKNTGGMGCYAPTQIATPELMARIHNETLQPTIDHMREEGYPFIGCLFTGFMITPDGPKVIEYNVRFGDPETQTLLPLLESDLADILMRCTRNALEGIELRVKPESSATIVVAAGGYPDKYEKGTKMTLKPTAANTYLFHAGTSLTPEGALVTSGGRVIASTAVDESIRSAVDMAYVSVRQCIDFDRMHYRTDIARRELRRLDAPET